MKMMGVLYHHVLLLLICKTSAQVGGACFACECIVYSLIVLQAGAYNGHYWPRKVNFQFDNASDNKGITMIGLCGMLVLHAVFEVVDINFLIVGHTHEVRPRLPSPGAQQARKHERAFPTRSHALLSHAYHPLTRAHSHSHDLILRGRTRSSHTPTRAHIRITRPLSRSHV